MRATNKSCSETPTNGPLREGRCRDVVIDEGINALLAATFCSWPEGTGEGIGTTPPQACRFHVVVIIDEGIT